MRAVIVVALGLLCAGCGDGESASEPAARLLAGPEPVTLAVRGPVTRALETEPRRAPPDPVEVRTESDGVRLTADGKAKWEQVRASLQEKLPDDGATPLDLRIDGRTRLTVDVERVQPREDVAFVLKVTLEDEGTQIRVHGNGWVRARGCGDVSFVDVVDGWGARAQSLWADRLDEMLSRSRAEDEGYEVAIQAASSVGVSDVAPFIEAAIDRDVAPLDLGIRPRKKYDDAVHDGGRWLDLHQLPSGGWHEEYSLAYCEGKPFASAKLPRFVEADILLTARVVATYLGAGYTPRGKHAFARVLTRAVRLLRRSQRTDGRFGHNRDLLRDAWASLAMIECFGMTESPLYGPTARCALRYLQSSWSWRAPASTTAAVAAALHSAMLVNADFRKRGHEAPLPVDEYVVLKLREATEGIDVSRGDLDAAAALCARGLLGERLADDKAALRSLGMLEGQLRAAGPKADPLLMYYAAHASFLAGGKGWDRMKRTIERFVVESQRKDGFFCCWKGSWDPQWDTNHGRIAGTVFHALTLELFYRYDRCMCGRCGATSSAR